MSFEETTKSRVLRHKTTQLYLSNPEGAGLKASNEWMRDPRMQKWAGSVEDKSDSGMTTPTYRKRSRALVADRTTCLTMTKKKSTRDALAADSSK